MTDLASSAWPTTGLDPVRRLKVIAATARHPMVAERHLDAPLADVWRVASDLEGELPRFVRGLRSFNRTADDTAIGGAALGGAAPDGAAGLPGPGRPESGLADTGLAETGPDEALAELRFSAVAVSALRHRERFHVVLRPGWCLMQSRMLVGGMAAVEEGSGTRFAMLCSFRFPGGGTLQGLRLFRAEVRSQAMLDRLEQRVAQLRAG